MNENDFENFKGVRQAYLKLIEIFNNQNFKDNDLEEIIMFYKRIKINSSILTILNAIERLNFNELDKNYLNEIINCFEQKDIDLNGFRNCLAHAHYEVSRDFNSITIKKGDFGLVLNENKLEELAIKIDKTVKSKLEKIQLQFDGIKLNKFLIDLISGKTSIDTDAETYATLIQSYNIYHAYLYEKTIQMQEQKRISSYYENKILINLNLPYINQDTEEKPTELQFESLRFEDLTDASKADLLYLLFTSEYRKESINEFKKIWLNVMTDEDIIKRIAALYFYPIGEYRNLALSFFKNNDIEKDDNLEAELLEYKKKNIEVDYNKKIDNVVNFMLEKLPKMGRIDKNGIMPMKKDLLHGFYKRNGLETFIYPNCSELIKYGTKGSMLKKYIDEEVPSLYSSFEITEQKIVTKSEFMFFMLLKKDNLDENIEVSKEMEKIFTQLSDMRVKNPDLDIGTIFR